MKKFVTLLLFSFSLGSAAFAQEAQKPAPFNPFDIDFSQWKHFGNVKMNTDANGEKSVTVKIAPDSKSGGAMASTYFKMKPYCGKYVVISADVTAKDVTKPKHAWDGIKIMVTLESNGKKQYINRNNLFGDYEPQKISYFFLVPEDACNAEFHLGIVDSKGEVVFKNPKLEVVPFFEDKLPENFKCEYTDRVKNMPTLRGFMSSTTFTPKNFEDMKAWGANLVRWQLCRNWGSSNSERDMAEYDSWMNRKIDELHKVLEHAQKLDMKVVIDVHSPVGGRYKNREFAMFHEDAYFEKFLEIWKKLAATFKDHPALWGFDIINEPAQTSYAKHDYLKIQYEVAKAIRLTDAEVPIIIESNGWDSPRDFKYLTPFNFKNIIYEVHMYEPHAFTHQNVKENNPEKILASTVTYPGMIDKTMVDKAQLEKILKPVIRFKEKYGARIYVGEFSAIRWAPGAEKYLQDVIDIFEKNGWDWSYHAFREWQGWNPELGTDPRDTKVPAEKSERQKVLENAFKLNKPLPQN